VDGSRISTRAQASSTLVASSMEPYLNRDGVTIYNGHVLDVLRQLPSDSVHCCCTSPPYFGLRDYGLPPTVWGGDAACEHEWGDVIPPKPGRGNKPGDLSTSSLTNPDRQDTIKRADNSGQFCQKCSAWLGCYGLEPTPELYVEHTVEIFREVRRVLRPDGTLWLNIGDSYASQRSGHSLTPHTGNVPASRRGVDAYGEFHKTSATRNAKAIGVKDKDLIGVPWMVAFALRADGWYLRSEIIWHKRSCMPESVKDRPSRAHEQVFLLAKSKRYFYDNVASAEKATSSGGGACIGKVGSDGPGSRRLSEEENDAIRGDTRNMRSVWSLSSEPYKESHFAVFPTELVRRCLLAGTSSNSVVLDPFFGSGTTGAVAQELGCRCVGIELNPEYCKMAAERFQQRTFLVGA
jgi:DNA modification methylase